MPPIKQNKPRIRIRFFSGSHISYDYIENGRFTGYTAGMLRPYKPKSN